MFSTVKVDSTPDLNGTLFTSLLQSLTLERLAPTRQAANLALPDSLGHLPIVRTTTPYTHIVQPFPPSFLALRTSVTDAISAGTGHGTPFNNAMVELYDSSYTKMGFHTDQAQDLADESYICIFSCYEGGTLESAEPPRMLVVKNKRTEVITEYPMRNHECIVFSTTTNAAHVHKIVGGGCRRRWLGVTFRTSKTFVERREDGLFFVGSGKLLRRATEEDAVEMRKCKGRENKEDDFIWPDMGFTISEH